MMNFKKIYDRLHKEFKDKLVQEYAMMKNAYLQEYDQNYQANLTDKNSNIKEIQNHILGKDEDISDKKERYDAMKHKIFTMLRNKYSMFIKRIYFNEILYHAELSRREKRLNAYSKNYMHRRRVRNFFYSWRGVTHIWFKERINKEAVEFE